MAIFKRVFLYTIILLTALVLGWFLIPARMEYLITERYLFTSPDQDAVVHLAVLLPKTGPYQVVTASQITWSGLREVAPVADVDVVKFQGQVASGEVQEAVVTYKAILFQGPARWKASTEAFQLLPQVEIESDQPEFVELANQLSHGQTGADAYALYAYTSDYLSWPEGSRIGGNQSALTAYNTRIGGCGEFANFMVALSRAAGIPAQAVTGLALPAFPPFWTETTTWNHPGGAHAWVEVYADGYWHLADPSWGSSWPPLLKKIWFGRNDGTHLSYGETGQFNQIMEEMTAWGEQSGSLIGSMSAPIHFVATADSSTVTVLPTVTLQKGWDSRWVVSGTLYITMLVIFAVNERRVKKKKLLEK